MATQNEEKMEDLIPEDGPRILGIGLGLFFLILLWAFAFVAILAFSRFSSVTTTIIFSLTCIISIIAIALPRFPAADERTLGEAGEVKLLKIYDTPFIWRTILIVIMGIFLVVAGVSSLMKHCVEQVYAEPIRRRPHISFRMEAPNSSSDRFQQM